MRDDSRDPLDAVIDRASQTLVSGEPGPSLRAGVRDRIGARPYSTAVPAWGAAAAVLALAVLLRVLMGGQDAPARSGGEAPAVVVSRPVLVAPGTGLGREPGKAEAAAAVAAPTRRVAPPEELPVELEPLIPPIEIEPLVTTGIAVAYAGAETMPIEIDPLEIELIEVAQLPVPDAQLPTESKGA